MRVMNHNWSARKQYLHLQSVVATSRHSALSGDSIRQCVTSSGSCHKDTRSLNTALKPPCTQLLNIQYDSVYLTCSKKLTDSQLSLPHGTNKKCKIKRKNKLIDEHDKPGPVPLSVMQPKTITRWLLLPWGKKTEWVATDWSQVPTSRRLASLESAQSPVRSRQTVESRWRTPRSEGLSAWTSVHKQHTSYTTESMCHAHTLRTNY